MPRRYEEDDSFLNRPLRSSHPPEAGAQPASDCRQYLGCAAVCILFDAAKNAERNQAVGIAIGLEPELIELDAMTRQEYLRLPLCLACPIRAIAPLY